MVAVEFVLFLDILEGVKNVYSSEDVVFWVVWLCVQEVVALHGVLFEDGIPEKVPLVGCAGHGGMAR